MKLRVVTLNVWNTEGDQRRPDLINRELRKLDPDLIALQEVVQTDTVHMLDRLIAGLNLHSTHQADVQKYAPPFSDRYGGTAIASRWHHQVVEALDSRDSQSPDVPWATLATKVDLPELGELLFIASTSAWRPAAELSREQHAVAVSQLDERHRRELPTIIAGDFNATPDAASVRYLTGK